MSRPTDVKELGSPLALESQALDAKRLQETLARLEQTVTRVEERIACVEETVAKVKEFVGCPALKTERKTRFPKPGFPQFMKLPIEVRYKIWKLAAPGGRIFDVYLVEDPWSSAGHETRTAASRSPDESVIVKLRELHKPPAIRGVCRESRRVTDIVGSFKFGLFRGTRHGWWFNHACDIVLLSKFSLRYITAMNLRNINNVAFTKDAFGAEYDCVRVIKALNKHAPECVKAVFAYSSSIPPSHQSFVSGPIPKLVARLHALKDDDFVGRFSYHPCRRINRSVVDWGKARRTIMEIWTEEMLYRRNFGCTFPHLCGYDLVYVSGAYERALA